MADETTDATAQNVDGQHQLGASEADVATVMEAMNETPPSEEPEFVAPSEDPQAPTAKPDDREPPAEAKPEEGKEEAKPAEPAPPAEKPKEEMSAAEMFSRLAEGDKRERYLRSQLKDGGASLDALRQKAKDDPKAFLDDFGIGFDQALDAFTPAQEEPATPEGTDEGTRRVLEHIKALEEKVTKFEDAEKTRGQQKMLNDNHDRIRTIVSNDKVGDRWTLVNAYKDTRLPSGETPVELIFNTSAYIYQQSQGQQIPDYADVADMVERHLESVVEQEMQGYAANPKTKAIARRLLAAKEEENGKPAPDKALTQDAARTEPETPQQMATPEGRLPQADEWDEEKNMQAAIRGLEEDIKKTPLVGA
jgi:hypothetical protein